MSSKNEIQIAPITPQDGKSVIDIFNYYIENTFAAYPETPLPYPAFDILMQMAKGYATAAIKDIHGNLLGYGMLRSHSPIPAFKHTAEISYFLHFDYTGKGLGKNLLDYLETGAQEMKIKNILASISSLNPRSISFHGKNGFAECGRFKNVGKKKGKSFDVVWMQKVL